MITVITIIFLVPVPVPIIFLQGLQVLYMKVYLSYSVSFIVLVVTEKRGGGGEGGAL